ncbi:BAG family molecular chaperone regulator 4-like [Bidens hawaiensis]|uniref:BAG family molecular chaperone regulator 4-like n=1 Tax=Bidens hawaiensis TaxID=980011 RepID=UPI004049B11C
MMEDHGGDTAATTGDNGGGNMKIKVTFGSSNFDVFTSPQSTFGDLKREIAKATGVDPKAQTVLFRGKESDDHESLQMPGVKDNAKVILIENTPTKNEDLEKVEEIKENIEVEISRGLEAVNRVREENNQFAQQVVSLETMVCCGTQIQDKDFVYLTEMLMRQLLKLDGIDAEGDGRMQRKLEVRRVQGLVEKLDNLRAKNSNLTSNIQDESSLSSSLKVNQEGEVSKL